jgi:hypothetical protein
VVAGECLGEGVGLLQSPKPELGADGFSGVPAGEADVLVEIRLPLAGRLLERNPLCELKVFEALFAADCGGFGAGCDGQAILGAVAGVSGKTVQPV